MGSVGGHGSDGGGVGVSSMFEALEGTVDSRHLSDEATANHRAAFHSHPARLVVLREFLCDDVAARLSRFLLEQADFYTEYGLESMPGPAPEDVWRGVQDDERFFRMGKIAGTPPEFRTSPEAITYLKFRRLFQEPSMVALFEAISGFPLRSTDDFGVHAMADGDFLRPHSDANGDRRLAIVLYLTPDWQEEHGGLLEVGMPGHDLTRITPAYNSIVAFDVRTGAHHAVTPVALPAGGAPRVTIGGWYDAGGL